MARLGTRFGGAWGILPCSGVNHIHTPYTDEQQVLSSLYMPSHDFTTAINCATSEQLRERVGCAYLIYPVQGVHAAGPLDLCRNVKFRVLRTDNICNSRSLFRFHRCRIDDIRGRSLVKKYPKKYPKYPFRDPFWRDVEHLAPLRNK